MDSVFGCFHIKFRFISIAQPSSTPNISHTIYILTNAQACRIAQKHLRISQQRSTENYYMGSERPRPSSKIGPPPCVYGSACTTCTRAANLLVLCVCAPRICAKGGTTLGFSMDFKVCDLDVGFNQMAIIRAYIYFFMRIDPKATRLKTRKSEL